jgi:hypothetical protein
MDQLEQWIREHRPRLVVIDSIAAVFDGDAIQRRQVRSFLAMLRKIARDNDTAIVLLDHPSVRGMADGSGTANSVDWRNSVRSMLHLSDPDKDDQDVRELTVTKSRPHVACSRHGATCMLPPKVTMSCALLLPQNVTLAGAGRLSSILKDCDTEPSGNHFITVGDDKQQSACFGSLIRNLGVFRGSEGAPSRHEGSSKSEFCRARTFAAGMQNSSNAESCRRVWSDTVVRLFRRLETQNI